MRKTQLYDLKQKSEMEHEDEQE